MQTQRTEDDIVMYLHDSGVHENQLQHEMEKRNPPRHYRALDGRLQRREDSEVSCHQLLVRTGWTNNYTVFFTLCLRFVFKFELTYP